MMNGIITIRNHEKRHHSSSSSKGFHLPRLHIFHDKKNDLTVLKKASLNRPTHMPIQESENVLCY